MQLSEGDLVPSFEGSDQDGKPISSENLKGQNYLLYFYPKDNTPGCTKEACAFRDNYAELKKVVSIIGVSADSGASHMKFREKYDLPFPLIADIDKKIIRAFGADGLIFPKRVSFLINDEGRIEKIYSKVDVSKHVDEIKMDIAVLKS